MKKNKFKIIATIIAVAALVFAFWWGGDSPNSHGWSVKSGQSRERVQAENEKNNSRNGEEIQEITEKYGETTKNEKSQSEERDTKYSEENGMKIDEKTGKDSYMTEPVPSGKPIPVEPDQSNISSEEKKCKLSIRCDTILKNLEWLDKEKVELVPENGIIFAEQTVTFFDGESVFNVLQRETKKNKIHMEYTNVPLYNSAYIEGIGNLYEFDCGELSGWMYNVNGWFPNYGCSRYELKDGDKIEFVYTCDLGADVGGGYSSRNGM